MRGRCTVHNQDIRVWQSDPERRFFPLSPAQRPTVLAQEQSQAEFTGKTCGTEALVKQYRPTLGCKRYHWSIEVKQKSRCCLPSTHGRVALSTEQVQEKPETVMDMRQEPAHRLRRSDTARQTPVLRRSDRGRHNSRIEVWKLMRELGDMNKSLFTLTGVSQRGFDQRARGQLFCARVVADISSHTQNGEKTTTECGIHWTRVTSSLVRATDNGNASTTEEPKVDNWNHHSRLRVSRRRQRAKRSRATRQYEDRGA